MKLLRQLFLILFICFLGEAVHKVLGIPIPGSVIGMVLLFLCLCARIIKLEMISEIAGFLINHLAFFFIPAGVGLLAYMNVLKNSWVPIVGISFITTVIVLIVTGYTVQLLKRRAQ